MTPCSMASLVEADHDDRLGAREKASVGRHLLVCAECRDHAADLRELRELATSERVSVPPMDHHRGRVRLLQEAASPRADAPGPYSVSSSPRSFRRAVAFATMSCVVLFATLAFGFLHETAPRLEPSVAAAYASLKLNIVAGDAGAGFKRSQSAGLDLVELASGTVHVRVHHLVSGERFVVRTADAEVEVRGTQFDVEARAGVLVHVTVAEGTVELRRAGEIKLLPAGTEWNAPVVAALDRPNVPSPESAPTDRANPETRGELAPRSGLGKPSETSTGSIYDDALGAPGADDAAAFRSGMARLEKGDFGQAATDLQSFATMHPDDPRTEDAAFLEALSLSRAGRTADAAIAARAYLAKYPHGYRRAEAEKLLQKSE